MGSSLGCGFLELGPIYIIFGLFLGFRAVFWNEPPCSFHLHSTCCAGQNVSCSQSCLAKKMALRPSYEWKDFYLRGMN